MWLSQATSWSIAMHTMNAKLELLAEKFDSTKVHISTPARCPIEYSSGRNSTRDDISSDSLYIRYAR